MNAFSKYNDILLEAYLDSDKSQELVTKKVELLREVMESLPEEANSILFVGFSPWCLGFADKQVYITAITDTVRKFLDDTKVNIKYVDLLEDPTFEADVVVAADEFFTFASDDTEQRQLIEILGKATGKLLITTLRDYKNQDYKDREFSQPLHLRGHKGKKIYLEHYEYDFKDKNSFISSTYVIGADSYESVGPMNRRNMFFKQLAKFSLDVGASNFFVHKNLMYKSIIKRNYEHIITIRF